MIRATILFLLLASVANADPVTIEWQWPMTYCDGATLDPADIAQAEIYIDTQPITASSDIESDPCAVPTDIPPDSAVLHSVNSPETRVVIDLAPGTYYLRMRVQAGDKWSNLSGQAEAVVDTSQPGVPIIIRIG